MSDHICDLTVSSTCKVCGYKHVVPRFGFDVSVFDNKRKGDERYPLNESFMTDDPGAIADALRKAADVMDGIE